MSRPPALRTGPSLLRLCPLLVACGVGLLSYEFYGKSQLQGMGDTCDYAAMGRNLADGRGFTTSVVYPLQLSMETGVPHAEPFDPRGVPNLHRPPLLPLWYAGVFRLVGCRDSGVLGTSFLFYAGVLGLVLGWKRKSWPIRVGVACLASLYPPLVRHAASGLTETPAAFLCLVLSLVLLSKKRNLWAPLFSGAVIGLLFLLKYYLILLVPAAVVLVWPEGRQRHRWPFLGLLFLGWFVVAAPWLWRNYRVAGDPFFTLQAYCEIAKGIPGYEAFRAHRGWTPVDTPSFAAQNPGALLRKSLGAWVVWLRSDWGTNFLPLLVGCGLWWSWRKDPSKATERAVLLFWSVATISLVALLAPVNLEPRYLLCTQLPLLILPMVWFAEKQPLGGSGQDPGDPRSSAHTRRFLAGTLMYFVLVNGISMWRAPEATDRREDAAFVAERVPEDGLLVSDADGFVAWRVDRPVVWLPSDEETLEKVLDRFPVRAVYLQEGIQSQFFQHYRSPENVLEYLGRRYARSERTPCRGRMFY